MGGWRRRRFIEGQPARHGGGVLGRRLRARAEHCNRFEGGRAAVASFPIKGPAAARRRCSQLPQPQQAFLLVRGLSTGWEWQGSGSGRGGVLGGRRARRGVMGDGKQRVASSGGRVSGRVAGHGGASSLGVSGISLAASPLGAGGVGGEAAEAVSEEVLREQERLRELRRQSEASQVRAGPSVAWVWQPCSQPRSQPRLPPRPCSYNLTILLVTLCINANVDVSLRERRKRRAKADTPCIPRSPAYPTYHPYRTGHTISTARVVGRERQGRMVRIAF